MLMNTLKQKLNRLKLRVKKYFNRVPIEIHEKALIIIEEMKDTIEQLERKNSILERQVIALEMDIKYRESERLIDQSFIAELLADILKYTDVPGKKIKSLESRVSQAKKMARKNYGRK
jgi:hypothetical protein